MSEREARSQEWAIKVQASFAAAVFYKVAVGLLRLTLAPWLKLKSEGAHHLSMPGPVVLAPVHRSNLDSVLVALVAERRLRALGKESLFVHPIFSWVNSALGAIPVRRGEADRQAMRFAQEVIASGEMMIVFPEGTRQTGPTVEGVFDGTAYLAHKAGAPIIPIGIAGTEEAMGSGTRGIKRVPCAVVVGEPIYPPEGRMSRGERKELSERMTAELQAVFDRAQQVVS